MSRRWLTEGASGLVNRNSSPAHASPRWMIWLAGMSSKLSLGVPLGPVR